MKKNSLLNFLSDTGYKRNSPDVNRPLNVIPSGRITMQDVDFPVRGVDNLGNEMFMMPGGEYFFPGDYVVETPMMQRGGLTFQQYYTPAAESTSANYTPTMTVQAAERLKAMRDAQELARRKQAIQASQAAASRSFRERLTPENLAQETGATGDKLRFFPNDPDSFIDDYLNPLKMVGDMASGLGRIPLNVKQGNYGAAALDVAIPVATGALAGLGAKSAGQFVNNLANPLAGTGQFLTTKTPLKNAYKILGNNTRFFNPGETPHWIKGYQQDWNPMIADLEPLANFRQQQATRILSNTKMFKESEAIWNKYADKLDELIEQKKSFLKSNDKDAVLDANRQIAEIFNNRDKDFDDLNNKYFTSKEHPFDTRLGSGSYGSVYGLPKLNYAVKVGNLPKGEDAYKLVELSKNIEKSNIAVPKRAYNTSSGENVMVMSKVDPIQGNFALNPPIEQSYRELIKDVEALRNKGLYLDFQNPENIRYNPSTGLFNIYDLNSTGYILGKNINEKSYDVSKKTVEELLAEHKLIPELPGSPNAFKSEIDWAKWNPETPKPAWQMQELPGLHLKSTMEGETISKIVEPKTGLVNVEQALAIIGKESGGADKVALIKQGLGETIPKKMDYNEFRKVVQDQLIPLERQFATEQSNYGLYSLGYPSANRSTYEWIIKSKKEEIARYEKAIAENPKVTERDLYILKNDQDNLVHAKSQLLNSQNDLPLLPLENQTLILGNKYNFGRGSSKHSNPEETLGHIHFLRDAETPDVLTVTQIQSDAFQGTHRIMPKTQQEALEKVSKLKEEGREIKSMFGDGKESSNSVLANYEKNLQLDEASAKNFTQKQLLDKNHQERYLQELVDYAGKRGDINKVRVPTSETAAKVQGYYKNTATGMDEMGLPTDLGYSPQHQTILKKYSEQPKTIKKLFGVEPKIVTDSKGNSWYEFDIPDKAKKGKMEIKAFTTTGAVIGVGALQETPQYQKGGQQVGTDILDKYKSYIMGDYKPEEEKDLKNAYDKLNRHYYKKAKETGKSVPNYIMSLL